MAPGYSNQLPIHPAIGKDAEFQQQMLEAIESIWWTVRGSHRSINDACEAIARADKALARRIGAQICLRESGK